MLVGSCFLEECVLGNLTEVGDGGGSVVCVAKDGIVSGRIL